MIKTYSLHKINDSIDLGFSPDEYSRFKFGDEKIAKKFGDQLAEGFIETQLIKEPIAQQIVVISSPYSFIPTATFCMKNYFVFRLNRWLSENGFPVIQEAKVHRTITYKEDYGELDAEERIKLIGNDSFQIDKNFLIGKTIVFLDDIKITGSHERMILKMVDQYNLPNEIHLLYFAELTNKDIPPQFENYLNYHFVKSIFDVEKIIHSKHFFINTRIVKYILNYDFDTFCVFLENQSDEMIHDLFNMALGNSYHSIEVYAKNFNFMKNYLFNNKKTVQQNGN
jgi:hypothetical protein